jgi:hypothetical protein
MIFLESKISDVSDIVVYDRFIIRFKIMNLISLALSSLRQRAAF